MKTIIKIKTWVCPECNYHQDFDPDNAGLMTLHFPDVEVGYCPACCLGKNETKIMKKVKMIKETREDKKTTITIMGEEVNDMLSQETEEPLTATEKKKMKDKIKADIKKFKLLED